MYQYKRGFDEDLKPLAKREDANVRAQNTQSCIKFMNKMLKTRGFMWCAGKLPKRLPEIFVYDEKTRSILLTEDASKGMWYLTKKGKASAV